MISGIEGDPTVYLNGEWLPLSQAKISVLDRGFVFGDGVYDVVPSYGGKPFRMEHHLARLMRSLETIRLASPFDTAGWADLVHGVLDRAPAADCRSVYIQVTRGVAKRDHAFPPASVTPTVFAMANAFTPPTAEARARGLTAVAMADERWLHCDIKSISLLGNILAKQYAVDRDVDDVVQFRDGFLTEASASNVWIAKNGVVLGAPTDHRILKGIRYELLAEIAAARGVPFEIRPITRAEVDSADEIMMSGAQRELLPVLQFEGRPVGTGSPGPVYASLRAGYDDLIAAVRAA